MQEVYYKRALNIQEKLAPRSLDVAGSLNSLGAVAESRGDFAVAEDYLKRALDIREKQAPGSLDMAESLNNLGNVYAKRHLSSQALPLFAQAADILEAQRNQIAGPDARTLLLEANTDAFSALLSTYVSLHQVEKAFNTLERTRGRSLAENLFEHQNLSLDNELPQTLRQQQLTLDNDRSIALHERQRLDPSDPKDKPRYTKNDARLNDLNFQQRQLEAQIRQVAPHYASLHYPKPLQLHAVQQALDPGTLLLEYAIDEQTTYLFTLTNTTLHCYPLAIKRKDLLAQVQALSTSLSTETAPANPAVAAALYNRLLRPAQKEITAARRLLLCPEKALWKLPFCALIDNNAVHSPHYLVQSKPLHYVVAMNVYAQLRQSRTRPHPALHSLLAFGDPAYRSVAAKASVPIHIATGGSVGAPIALAQATVPGADAQGVPLPSDTQANPSRPTASPARLLLGGHSFARVFVTGAQVRALGALFGKEAVVHLGKEATPSRVFQEAGSARILHFACHGFLDDRDPLASFLALSPERSGEDFGRVAAYEVVSRLHLNADLVTLGACETGAGEQSSTEGVIGLTRAFEYAGARSVLVSLWAIDANSASLLLSGTEGVAADKQASQVAISQSFYGALQAGQSKDEALRIAQMALIGGKRVAYRDPRNWAAFSLIGDWR